MVYLIVLLQQSEGSIVHRITREHFYWAVTTRVAVTANHANKYGVRDYYKDVVYNLLPGPFTEVLIGMSTLTRLSLLPM